MRKLNTIQKRENLNDVYGSSSVGSGGAYHDYYIHPKESAGEPIAHIQFQKGPRKLPESRHGIIDSDLLEIVRDRLKCFQDGQYAVRENEMALEHIESALMWMNRRVEDRIEREVLGTTKV